MGQQSGHHFRGDEFANLPNLRLLWVEYDCDYYHLFDPVVVEAKNFKVILKDCLRKAHPFIFSELRWLSLHGFLRMRFTRNITLQKLAILDLSYGGITSSWSGWSHIKIANNLKVLNLSYCDQLVKTPDFSYHLLLEQLILKGCVGLFEIDKSISMLQHLVIINLSGCFSLKKLPEELSCMESLEELDISWTSIVEIPSWALMRRLRVFNSSACSDLEKVSSLDFAINITKLSLVESRITILPYSIGKLVNLLSLSLQYCKGIKTLPESIGDLVSLVELSLDGSGIVELPDTIGSLRNLETLDIGDTPIRRLPTAIGMMENLLRIRAWGCSELQDIPKLPKSLISLHVSEARIPVIPDLSNLINLTDLVLELEEEPVDLIEGGSSAPWWIGMVTSLEILSLKSKCIISLHEDLSSLKKLKDLYVWSCPNLVEILGIHMLENLEKLSIDSCAKLQSLPNLSSLKKLKYLGVWYCPNLVEIPCIDMLENLEKLFIKSCAKVQSLPDLSNLKKLQHLEVSCPKLVEIPGIDMLENLENLSIEDCEKLQSLPDLSNLKKLKDLEVLSCPNLVEITGRLESLSRLQLRYCQSLEKYPDIPNRKTMHFFSIEHCGKKDKSSLKLLTCI